jgi:4-phosphopantoate--beta-alanine ligase
VLDLTDIPKSHPRYESLVAREKIAQGVRDGITSTQGLIAQGRGEAFDYLIGEVTTNSANAATKMAAAMLLLANQPALSVNGNVAALVPESMVALSKQLSAPLEVNLFHRTEERVGKIATKLRNLGADYVLGEEPDEVIAGLDHARAKATKGGIYDADVVLIPLEDGDRCEALARMGKRVIAIDLNPLSRTSKMASVTIVDNIVRAIPNLIKHLKELSKFDSLELNRIVNEYDNAEILRQSVKDIQSHLAKESQ